MVLECRAETKRIFVWDFETLKKLYPLFPKSCLKILSETTRYHLNQAEISLFLVFTSHTIDLILSCIENQYERTELDILGHNTLTQRRFGPDYNCLCSIFHSLATYLKLLCFPCINGCSFCSWWNIHFVTILPRLNILLWRHVEFLSVLFFQTLFSLFTKESKTFLDFYAPDDPLGSTAIMQLCHTTSWLNSEVLWCWIIQKFWYTWTPFGDNNKFCSGLEVLV